jgi:hypothetical protein
MNLRSATIRRAAQADVRQPGPSAGVAARRWGRRISIIALALAVVACGGGGPTPPPTLEEKLATVHGDGDRDPAVVAEFGRILDAIQAGGICDPEPDREHVADVLVASWNSSGKRDSLLEWARAVAAVCAEP